METNKLLGILLLLTGAADIVIARFLGDRLTGAAKTAITLFGAGFLLIGALLSLGVFKVV